MAIEGATMNGLPDEEEDDATIMTFDTYSPLYSHSDRSFLHSGIRHGALGTSYGWY